MQVLVPMSPLLGLIGTVSGMLEVFDSMALRGTADARSMASGVSAAMICTMTGLAVSITGLYPVHYFTNQSDSRDRTARRPVELLAMRKRRHCGSGHESSHGIDLAPMLDFVINLLIFFIITAVFVKESGLIVIARPASRRRRKTRLEEHPDPDSRQRRDLGRQPRRRRRAPCAPTSSA